MANDRMDRLGGTDRRPTKAERKEQARLERIEIQRRMAARRRNRGITTVVLALAVAAVIAFAVTRQSGSPSDGVSGSNLGILTTQAPWPANTDLLAGRMAQLQLPPEGGVTHFHPHLDIFIAGQQTPVPAQIGLAQSISAPLHTHDDTGIIHAEAAVADATFTLGEFFDVWGVRFTPDCIGAYCAQGSKSLQVFVNGEKFSGDPRTIQLDEHQEIAVAYGTTDELPDPIPSTYDFAAAGL